MNVRLITGDRRVILAASLADPDALIVSPSTAPLLARNGVVVRLYSTPRYILLALAAARGGILAPDELHDLIFRERRDGGPMSLDAYVAHARAAAAAVGLTIKTHTRRGFSLHRVVKGDALAAPIEATPRGCGEGSPSACAGEPSDRVTA
jgi:DNA-binding winged helix-turn-helix (wHTH) protein